MFSEEVITQLAEQLAPLIAAKIKVQPPVMKRLLDVEEAAIYLGRTPNSIRILECRGILASVRTDGRCMFDVRELDKWIESGKTQPRA